MEVSVLCRKYIPPHYQDLYVYWALGYGKVLLNSLIHLNAIALCKFRCFGFVFGKLRHENLRFPTSWWQADLTEAASRAAILPGASAVRSQFLWSIQSGLFLLGKWSDDFLFWPYHAVEQLLQHFSNGKILIFSYQCFSSTWCTWYFWEKTSFRNLYLQTEPAGGNYCHLCLTANYQNVVEQTWNLPCSYTALVLVNSRTMYCLLTSHV